MFLGTLLFQMIQLNKLKFILNLNLNIGKRTLEYIQYLVSILEIAYVILTRVHSKFSQKHTKRRN